VNDIKSVLDAVLGQRVDSLTHGERIKISGIGSFYFRHRAPRLARNPKTGETVDLPAKTVAHFKSGKEMRDRVNEMNDQLTKT
jgi:integration host factor subunit beta